MPGREGRYAEPSGWIALPCEPYRGLNGEIHQDYVNDEAISRLRHSHAAVLFLRYMFWCRCGRYEGDPLTPARGFDGADCVGALLDMAAVGLLEIEEMRPGFVALSLLEPYRSWKRDESYRVIQASTRTDVLSSGPCRHCGRPDGLVVDHIRPVARGGGSERSNLQPLCRSCNSRKGARFVG